MFLPSIEKNTQRCAKGSKKKPKKEECELAMYAQDKGNHWYIDSGCSKHMTRDHNKFLTLKEKNEEMLHLGIMLLQG
jgi:hypothetical protein